MAGRPISLRAVRERLLTAIRNACVPWRATYSGKAPLNEDAENAFLRIVVAWETFLSDWLVSAVVRDPTVLGMKYQNDLEEWLASKYGLSVADYQAATHLSALKATLHFASPTFEEVRTLLDPRGRNIEFRDLKDFRARAERLAAPSYATRARSAIPQSGRPNDGVVEAASAIRNWLAHRSPLSREEMRTRLASLRDANLASAGFPSSAGGYLKHLTVGPAVKLPLFTPAAQPAGTQPTSDPYGRRRIVLYANEYVRIAWRLVPIEDT